MTGSYIHIDPEAILIRMRVGAFLWRIVNSEQSLTWYAVFLSQGSERP
jgi:hypothetical protein